MLAVLSRPFTSRFAARIAVLALALVAGSAGLSRADDVGNEAIVFPANEASPAPADDSWQLEVAPAETRLLRFWAYAGSSTSTSTGT